MGSCESETTDVAFKMTDTDLYRSASEDSVYPVDVAVQNSLAEQNGGNGCWTSVLCTTEFFQPCSMHASLDPIPALAGTPGAVIPFTWRGLGMAAASFCLLPQGCLGTKGESILCSGLVTAPPTLSSGGVRARRPVAFRLCSISISAGIVPSVLASLLGTPQISKFIRVGVHLQFPTYLLR